MRLLYDQNLSPRLKEALDEVFPESIHVADVGLDLSNDAAIWNYARDHGFAVVTKDSDFPDLSFAQGHPPKVVWIRLGNCSTVQIETLLHEVQEDLLAFDQDEQGAVIALPYDEIQPA